MNNPVLISESFERAAYNLANSMDRMGNNNLGYDIERFERSVEQFKISVDKLATIAGMQAENDQRKALGHSMAYTREDFVSI